MKVIDPSKRLNYLFDPSLHFGFESIEVKTDLTLVISLSDMNEVLKLKGPLIYLDLEEPNRFLTNPFSVLNRNGINETDIFQRVLSLCPYTNELLGRASINGYKSVFFPVNTSKLPEIQDKAFDVVYSGHLHTNEIRGFINSLRRLKLNICVIGNSDDPLITHKGVSYDEKIKLISMSKFSIVHNQLFIKPNQVRQLKKTLPNFQENKAFSELSMFSQYTFTKTYRAPQLKSRLFESAICGTIPIVIKDKWNLALNWFTSDEIIMTSEDDLSETIKEQVSSYSRIYSLAAHLKNKTETNYSSEAFARLFFGDI